MGTLLLVSAYTTVYAQSVYSDQTYDSKQNPKAVKILEVESTSLITELGG